MKICNENIVKDEDHLLITCLTYKIIHEKYDDLLNGHDHVSVILKFSTEKGEQMCACINFTSRVSIIEK